jgi:predicted glycoside hydrolase/deacetylase ChbG (UPF0249 family)
MSWCIVNADDFGHSLEVNQAICNAFARNLISSCTLLANLEGFEDAIDRALSDRLNGKIGVHLNLTEGNPLTTRILTCSRFAREGRFSFSVPISSVRISPHEADAIRTEWTAQIQRCVDAGLTLSHIDSHHHVHTVWPLLNIAIDVARKFGISRLRLSRNIGPKPTLAKQAYKALINRRIWSSQLSPVRYFGSVYDALSSDPPTAAPLELMVHLRMIGGTIMDVVAGRPDRFSALDDALSAIGVRGNLVSYSEV